MPKSVTKFTTPQNMEERDVSVSYSDVGRFLMTQGFFVVPVQVGIPFGGYPLCCYKPDNSDYVSFNTYIHGGMSAPPTRLTMIVISETDELKTSIKKKFNFLEETALQCIDLDALDAETDPIKRKAIQGLMRASDPNVYIDLM